MEVNNQRNDNRGGVAFEQFEINENNDNNDDQADEDENENEGDDGNNNNIRDIDLEDDEEDGDNDSTYDGGVAVNPEANPEDASSKAKKHSSECDLLLYIYCEEPIDLAPDHPILRPGVTVSIGLDKTTKLKAVFKQYVDFCNSKSKADSSDSTKINIHDLEFIFCQLLKENDTAETSALMKNDRIRVRKVRTSERLAEKDRKKTQREADRLYFQQMRHLLPESCPTRLADVILDCQGKLVDKNGRNQRVLSTTVRAHSSLIRKRCPWLMAIISQARRESKRQFEDEQTQKCETPDNSLTGATEIENDDEGENCNGIGQTNDNDEKEIGLGGDEISRAAQIDIVDNSFEGGNVNVNIVDDDEDDNSHIVSSSRHQIHSRPEVDVLTVVLSKHSPEAVKILLEYCYTNRVVSLGYNAFVQACKTRPNKHNGPVPPFHAKRWPNNGIPIIPFSVALAAIRLAEEAGMYRLSFMCEISASQLVTTSNVVEALTMSTRQKIISGNDLPRLRKAAMETIFRQGQRGVDEIGRSSCFKKALEEERSIIVPTLLQGTMEAVSFWEKAKVAKRDYSEISRRTYKDIDREESRKRAKERIRRRQERDPSKTRELGDENHNEFSDELYDEDRSKSWSTEAGAKNRSLRRMSHHNIDSIRRHTFSRVEMNLSKPNKKRSSRSGHRSDGFFYNRET